HELKRISVTAETLALSEKNSTAAGAADAGRQKSADLSEAKNYATPTTGPRTRERNEGDVLGILQVEITDLAAEVSRAFTRGKNYISTYELLGANTLRLLSRKSGSVRSPTEVERCFTFPNNETGSRLKESFTQQQKLALFWKLERSSSAPHTVADLAAAVREVADKRGVRLVHKGCKVLNVFVALGRIAVDDLKVRDDGASCGSCKTPGHMTSDSIHHPQYRGEVNVHWDKYKIGSYMDTSTILAADRLPPAAQVMFGVSGSNAAEQEKQRAQLNGFSSVARWREFQENV
ncbi:unnamed protein product, partial [Amoebophrya sp. A120]